MKKILVSLTGMVLFLQLGYAQPQKQVWTENFDSTAVSFVQSPTLMNYWIVNPFYSTSGVNAYRGRVPNTVGDSTVLLTPPYDLSNYSKGQLRFRQICKISPSDMAIIQYRTNECGLISLCPWKNLPASAYKGRALNYGTAGFNSASYPEWAANDLYLLPQLSWWEEEVFDLTDIASYGVIEFRFIIKKGNVLGSQFSYGWLLDDFRVVADNKDIVLPSIEFVDFLVKDTMHHAGPFDVFVRIQSQTSAPIVNTSFKYTTVYNGLAAEYAVPLVNTQPNIYKASIPTVLLNTRVVYSVGVEDALGNENTAVLSFAAAKDYTKKYDSIAMSIVSLDMPTQSTVSGGVQTDVKISLRNEGDSNLTDAVINWSVNGILQTPFPWSGDLSWGIADVEVKIGEYTPNANQYDTIVIWGADINNVAGSHSDSLIVYLYGCSGPIDGIFIISPDTTALSFREAMSLLEKCGVGGDVTFLLENGTYSGEIDLTDLGVTMGNYHLTISSLSGKRDSVILLPANGAGITLRNTNNVTIDKITVDASGIAVSAINFTGACTNIVISNCALLGNITGTTAALSGAPVNKASGTGVANNIRITNNFIRGGYYGINFYGGALGNFGKNIVIDSNVLASQYYYGIYPYYNELELLHNTVYYHDGVGVKLAQNSWRGIQVSNSEGNIIGNKIYQMAGLTSSVGLFIVSLNQYKKEQAIVANNEIIMQTGGANGAVYLSTGTKAIFAHNSMYVDNVTGTTARVMYVTDNINNRYTIKNNLAVLNGLAGFAIYLAGTTYSLNYDIDYNNYYVYNAAGNLGYAGANRNTLSAWQTIVTKDKNSMNVLPSFIDSLSHLQLTLYTPFRVPYFSEITTDINGNIRSGVTSIGAYGYNYTTNDALLDEFIDWRTGTLAGNKDSVKVVLKNGGTAPLLSANIAWSFNGGAEQNTAPWFGNLSKGQADTILLDEITYSVGSNSLKVWIKDFAADEEHANDTLYVEDEFCDTMLNGTYIVGSTGVFATVKDAMDRINTCGMNAPVTLALEDDTYLSTIDLSVYANLPTSSVNTITIEPLSGIRDNVIISPTSGNGILLGNIANIVINNITVDVSAREAYGIQFTDDCDNILITNCNIRVSQTATSSTSVPIYKGSGTGLATNVVIKNNIINGGYYGIYFYGGTGIDEYGTGIVIDSNSATNAYYYGMYFYYTDISSLSHNTITSRSSNATTSWYGLSLTNVNANINGNKIRTVSSSITSPYGMYLGAINIENTSARGLISNNEIILSTTSTYSGIYFSGAAVADIVHNSVYIDGTGAGRAVYIASQALTSLTIKNNNLVTTNTGGHPLYLANAALIQQCDIDYNNYFAPQYVGYVGAAMDLATWQAAVPQDLHSTDFQPDFANVNTGLQIQGTTGFRCPLFPGTALDIDGIARGGITTKGAYHLESHPLDVSPIAFVGLPQIANINDTIQVRAAISNVGNDTLTSFDIHWEINNIVRGFQWNGSLLPEDQIRIAIDTLIVQNGDNQITVWTSNPNQNLDMNTSNDTLRGSVVTCNTPLAAGIYTVGVGKDFSSVEAAYTVLNTCGIAGDVTFSIYPGIYPTILTLENIAGVDGINSLSFVSATGNADDVTIRGVIIGDNMNKISIENITIDAQYTNAGVRLNAPVRDIRIYGCKINANVYTTASSTTAAGTYGIFLNTPATTSTFENIQLIKNTIDGGYAGINIAGTTAILYTTTDCYIDSNYLTNQGYYGMNLRYTNIKSVSYNTVLSRETATSYWQAIYLGNMEVSVVNANKIRQRAKDITYPTGLYMTTVNDLTDPVLVTNNEMYIHSTSYYYSGFYALTSVNAKFLFNSVFASGSTSACIVLTNWATIRATVKYNNFIAADSCYPIYLMDAYTTAGWDVSDNNYYSPRWIGYATSAHTTLTSWQSRVTYDTTSTDYQPNFVDSVNSLELSDYSNFLVPAVSDVRQDIIGMGRIGITAKGCYTSPAPSVNLALETIENWGKNPNAGDSDTIKVVLRNGGLTPITSAAISYDFNGTVVNLPAWAGSLQTGQADTMTLDVLQYITGWNNLQVWIDSIPGLTDLYAIDDTLSVSGYFCDSALNGIYTIGTSPNTDFKTISDAVSIMYRCGVAGPVTFLLEDSLYLEHVRLEEAIPGSSAVNTVTFTSLSGNASDVTIQRPDDATQNLAPFILENVSNVIIDKLTLSTFSPLTNTYSYSNGILLRNGCDNITIDGCIFTLVKFGTPSATVNHSGINKPSSTGSVSNIRITNNMFDGGVYAVYMLGTTAAYNQNIYIANNTMLVQDKGSVYLQYADSVIIEKNSMGQRNEAVITSLQTFQPVYLANTDRIIVVQNTMKAARGIYGMYLSAVNSNLSASDGLIANNEIMMTIYETTATTARYGIYTSGIARTRIYHNSIRIEGNCLGHSMYVSSSTGISLDIQNNIFITTTTGASYPIYFAAAADAQQRTIFGYNDYYSAAGTNVGYAGIARATLADWVTTVPADTNSVSTAPTFVDIPASMRIQSNDGIGCPIIPATPNDILDSVRRGYTTMGAYHYESVHNDVSPYEIVSPKGTIWDTTDVIITIQSLGIDTLTSLTIHWIVNGQPQQPYNWTGKVTPNTISAPIQIGQITNFMGGDNQLIVWTDQPNGTADESPANDTVRAVFYACDSALNGVYGVGVIAGDFATVSEAVRYLCACGVSGATTFELENQEFEEDVAITGTIPGASPANLVTFTSAGGHYNTATIRRASLPNESSPALALTNVSNVRFTDLKITGWSSTSGVSYSYAVAVVFNDGCDNVEFSNCFLEIPYFTSAVNSTSYSVISRTIGAGIPISNIRILNNIISGGAYGIYHSGSGTGLQRDNNILVQGNEFVNVDNYGIRFSTADDIKVLNNTITQRPKYDAATVLRTFYGIDFSLNIGGSNNIIDGNRIKADSMYNGINFGTSSTALVSNNEIIAYNANSTASGIYTAGVSGITMRIINNSILIAQNARAATPYIYNVRGVYLGTSYNYELKNNHIVTLDSMSVPVYIATTYAAARYDVDYNNYFNPYGHIGYVSAALRSPLSAWKTIVTTDANSVSELPVYQSPGVSLKLTNTVNLACPGINDVTTDIEGYARYGLTIMGAYGSDPLNTDAAVLELTDVPVSALAGEKYVPAVKITNFGANPVNDVTLNWSLNGNASPAYTKTWNGTLNTLDNVAFQLDTLTAVLGNNDIVIWIESVNGAPGNDEYQGNDTVRTSFYACDSLFNGTYVVGSNGDFQNIADALAAFERCGVNGNITLSLANGTYPENVNLTNIDAFMGNYSLRIQSASGDRDSVIIRPTTGVVFLLNKSSNIAFENITIDASAGTATSYGIQFTGDASNIVVNNCVILANPIQNATTLAPIYKASSTGTLDGLTVKHCVLDGGYEGIRLYGASANYCKNITIDSNIFINQYYQGMYLYYVENSSISYNYITPRSSSHGATWYGIYAYYTNTVRFVSNKIYANNAGITSTLRGITLYYGNVATLVANNEIMLNSGASTTDGIYMDYVRDVLTYHNTVYSKKTGTAGTTRAIYAYINANDILTAKNNIFVADGGAVGTIYAIYLGGTAANHALCDINYNNYYSSGTNLGYAVAARADLAAWKANLPMDNNSISLFPPFLAPAANLELSDYIDYSCPFNASVPLDIRGYTRDAYTSMGAYTGYIVDKDIELVQVISPSAVGDLCSPNGLPVRFAVRNNGFSDCDFSVNPMELRFDMSGPIPFDTTIIINSGILKGFATEIIELKNMLDVSAAGNYPIEAWIAVAGFDTINSNDTLRPADYRNTKIALPFDDDFSTPDLTNLIIEPILRDSLWHVEDGIAQGSQIAPYYGTGTLVLRGETGTISRISTGQLELNKTQQPVLEFWYAHDNANPNQDDQIDVRLTYDGGNTYTTLFNIMRYDPTVAGPVWKKYLVDLSLYQDSSCVIISFEGYSYGNIQQIDRIAISSNQDLSISELIVPDLKDCDFYNKDLQVVITNNTRQNIIFDNDTTTLNVEISFNSQPQATYTFPLHNGILSGLESDTFLISGIDYIPGLYAIRAHFTNSIDNTPQDDTLARMFNVAPDIEIEGILNTNAANRIAAGVPVAQQARVYNRGSLDVSDILLTAEISDGSGTLLETLYDTLWGVLSAGASLTHTFTETYESPGGYTSYNVVVRAALACDVTPINNIDRLIEYVDLDDIELSDLDGCGKTIGENAYVEVQVRNYSPYTPFANIAVHAVISDMNNNPVGQPLSGNIDNLRANETIIYKFTYPYAVPNLSQYLLKVFVDRRDINPFNDTVTAVCSTVGIADISQSGFVLGQNIPNPAGDNTHIEYTLPEDGEVVFTVYSVTGQTLYAEKNDAHSGKNDITFSTMNLADGIYYYSMEYKGERIVKKMTIRK